MATTTADGIMLSAYVASLAGLLGDLGRHGVPARFLTCDGREIGAQRDRLAQLFLASEATHLLFVDSDMVFPPDLARRLLAFDKALVGIVYTKRMLDPDRLERLAARMPWDRALALAHSWNVRMLGRSFAVRDGLCRVAGIGGGFMLIRRDCLAGMAARLDLPAYADDPARLGYFSEQAVDDAILDCDYAFCWRWLACGGDVWAYADADVRHCGDDRTEVTLLDYLEARRRAGDARAGAGRHAP